MRPKLMALLLALAAAPAALAQAPSETPTAALLKSDAARLPLNPFDKDAIGALDWGRIAQSPAWRSASTVGLGAQAIPPFPWRFVKQITGRFAGVQFQATLQASKADAGWYRVALHTDRDTGEICDLVKAQLLSLYGPPTAHGHSDYALPQGPIERDELQWRSGATALTTMCTVVGPPGEPERGHYLDMLFEPAAAGTAVGSVVPP